MEEAVFSASSVSRIFKDRRSLPSDTVVLLKKKWAFAHFLLQKKQPEFYMTGSKFQIYHSFNSFVKIRYFKQEISGSAPTCSKNIEVSTFTHFSNTSELTFQLRDSNAKSNHDSINIAISVSYEEYLYGGGNWHAMCKIKKRRRHRRESANGVKQFEGKAGSRRLAAHSETTNGHE